MELEEVDVEIQPLERFIPIVGEQAVIDARDAAVRVRAAMGGRRLWNINSTRAGGGVAEMLRPLLAYGRGAGIDIHWLVIHGDREFFRITKRIHNAIHGERGDGSGLGPAERRHYDATLAQNADALLNQTKARAGDIALLHDPQTTGLIPALSRAGLHVIWRSHIGTDLVNAETERGWSFLLPYLNAANALVFSRQQYVPRQCPPLPTLVIQPSIDPFSTKNQELPPAVVRDVLAATGLVGPPLETPIANYRRPDGSLGEVRHPADLTSESGPPGFDVPLVVQISRWDTLKDPKGVMEGFVELLAEGGAGTAQLMLCGPAVRSVADDPDGPRVFDDVLTVWHRLPIDVRRRIHLASVPVVDIDENATVINALQRHATIVVQKSLEEGFGLTVTEPMWKSRPVIASRVGGIPDQIIDGESGLLLDDPSDLVTFGQLVGKVLRDPALASRLGHGARERVRAHFLGLRHLVQYARLFQELLGVRVSEAA